MKEKIKEFLKKNLLLIVVLVAFILICSYFGITVCPFMKKTGYPCPVCGATRAYLAAARLDFKAAFEYHPLFPILLPMFAYMAFGKKPLFRSKKREKVITILFFLTIFCVWIYKLYRIIRN
ncbi:MAG: DUF2752 domain-containing protein [Ruminococcus sp.]|nr:DUF2752 domain-containing protein [Ruminococcus sp.]